MQQKNNVHSEALNTQYRKKLNFRSNPAGSATAKQHELNTHKASWDQDDVGVLISLWEGGEEGWS